MKAGLREPAAAVDALAVSPIRSQVTITARPETPNETLVTAVRRAGEALPELAALFGVEPMSARERKKSRPARQKPAGTAPKPPAPAPSEPAPQPPAVEAPAAEAEAVPAAAAEVGETAPSVEDAQEPEQD